MSGGLPDWTRTTIWASNSLDHSPCTSTPVQSSNGFHDASYASLSGATMLA